MTALLSQYLDSVRENLRLGLSIEREVISELKTHVEDRLDEMRKAGLSEEEAAITCIKLLGSAKLLARQIYEAHSQGTWRQTLLASMPHLLFALLFALSWWQGIGWLIITLGLILTTEVYGWWHNKPVWLFPWLGYSMLPVVVAGLFLVYLPKGWSWLAILVYIPLALWLVGSITIQTIKKDWLYTALMLLPMPVIIGWFLAAGKEGKFPEISLGHIQQFAHWIGLSFLVLAITTAAFIRSRQRWLRVSLLLVSGLLTLVIVTFYAEGRFSLSAFSALTLITLGLLLSLALVERRIRCGKQQPTAQDAVWLGGSSRKR